MISAKSRRQKLLGAAWGTVVAVPLVWTVASWVVEARRIPSDADFAKAARALSERRQPGDAVGVAPWWALRGLAFVDEKVVWAAPDLVDFPPDSRRIWILAEPEGGEQVAAFAQRYKLLSSESFGRVTLALVDLGPPPSFHAARDIAGARIYLAGKGRSATPCDERRGRALHCRGRPEWQRVEPQILDVAVGVHELLWAHPPPAGERLVIEFPHVVLDRRLEVYGAHTAHGAQYAKAPVDVRVTADGDELARLRFDVGYGLKVYRIDTSERAGSEVTLRFAVSTSDNGANHFALDARTPRPAARRL